MTGKKNSLKEQINTYRQVLNLIRIIRFILFFYSAISFIFWFLNCFEVSWLYRFNWLFVIPYQIINKYYQPDGMTADFTLAIIGGICLLLGFIFDFVTKFLFEKLIKLEEQEEQQRLKAKQIRKRKTAKPVLGNSENGNSAASDAISPENNIELIPKLLFIITPHINKIKRKQDDIELTFQEVEIWKQRVNKKLLENISYSKPMQKGYYRKNLFLMYKDFNYTDDFIYYIKPTLDSIILEFKKYGISVSFCYVLSSITDSANLEKELDCMDTILSLNFNKEIIVTNRFKVAYDNKSTQQYRLKLKGEYNLSKNLTITNRQPLYVLYEQKQEEINQ